MEFTRTPRALQEVEHALMPACLDMTMQSMELKEPSRCVPAEASRIR
jgi:hypothetical protein